MLGKIAIIIILTSSIAHGQKLTYTMKDLEVLHNSKSYKEFLNHAYDIRPTERSPQWKNLVFRMAKSFISDLIVKENFTQGNFDYTEELASWPSLKRNEIFSLEKTKYSLRSLDHCYKNVTPVELCHTRLNQFWNSSKKYVDRPDISYRLGNYLAPYRKNDEVWNYFKIAANSKISIFYCTKAPMQQALLKKTMKSVDLNNTKAARQLYSLANKECWKKLSPTLQSLILSKDRTKRSYAFALMETLGTLKLSDKDLFLTHFLLQDPSVGETFNLAWNHIKLLGQKYKRRTDVIRRLKRFDPLPGKTFAIDDDRKKEILIDLLFKSIPEYLDHYAKTCLGYLLGNGHYPNGNPTMECRELIKNAKSKEWISPHIHTKFKSVLL